MTRPRCNVKGVACSDKPTDNYHPTLLFSVFHDVGLMTHNFTVLAHTQRTLNMYSTTLLALSLTPERA